MKIAELLNVAAAEPMGAAREPPLVHRRMDMASLDQFALQQQQQQQQQQQAVYQTKETRPTTNLSMSRIIQELEASGGEPKLQPATVDVRPPAVSADEQSPPPASKSTKTSGSTTKAKGTTARPRGRRSRAGCTPLTESEKRVKQRQLVKKSYYRKIDTLNELRGQVEALEHEFHTVLRTTGSATSPPDSPPTLRAKFAQLALDQDELRRENEQLRASAMDQAKARTRIGILLGEELRDHEAVAARLAKDAAVLADDDMAVYPQDPQADSPMEDAVHGQDSLMTVRDCLAVHREAVAQVRAFVASERFESSGARVFGWRDRRRVDGDTMHFLLEKTHRGVDAETLGDRMWTLASSMDGLKRLYMSPIPTEFQFIQRVDDHNVLFLRHMHVVDAVGRRSLLRSLVLVSLIEVDTGFLLLYRSVDHDRFLPEREKTIVTKGETVVWTDVFSWGLYERAGPRDCRNTFGGFVSALTSTRSIDFWLMQILVIAVRCESEVIGPLFLLGSGEAATNQHDDDDDDPKDQPM